MWVVEQNIMDNSVQSSADENVVDSPRAVEIHQQAPLLKKNIIQNCRVNPFRVITPQRQNNIWDDVPTPVCPNFSALSRPVAFS